MGSRPCRGVRRLRERGRARVWATKGQTVGCYKIVEHLGAGRMGEVYLTEDTALGREAALEKAFQEHSAGIAYFKVDPALDDLRGDPRFQDLIRRAGLTP